MADIPLWQDVRLKPLASTNNYTVTKEDDSVVFNGRVSSLDSEVVLNDIARGFLRQGFPSSYPSGGGAMPYDAAITLKLQPADLSNRYFIDFSYIPGRTANSAKTAPIDARVDMRQVLVASRASLSNTSVILYGKRANGTTTALKTFSGLVAGKGYNLIYPLADAASGYTEFYFSDNASQKYTPIPSCHRYVLYYLNTFGGWDSYILQGVVKASETYTPREFTRGLNNATPYVRNVVRYGTEIVKRWQIVTDWMHDAEQARFFQLLGSNNVYLVDMTAGFAPIPVVVRSNEWEARTFKTDGLFRTELTIEQATTLYR